MAAKQKSPVGAAEPELTGDGGDQALPPFDGEASHDAPAAELEPRQASLADCNRQLLESWTSADGR